MHPGVHASGNPDKPAVIMAGSGETVTYAELEDRSTRLARVLREAGIGAGDQAAFLTENQARFFELAWAAQRSGLSHTPRRGAI
jgi:acyl-CoA synthetase (AMP-forming)/AMP-acid ligase II